MEITKNKAPASTDDDKSVAKTGKHPVDEAPAQQTVQADVVQTKDSGEDLETVRRILFGEQARETEKRQAAMERYIQDSIDAIHQETQQQVESLQNDLDILNKNFELEVHKQQKHAKTLTQRFISVEHSVLKATEQAQQEYQQLDERLQQETERLENEINDWRKDSFHQLEQAQQQLQHDKADRQSIAALLRGMADQLIAEKDAATNV